MRRVGIESIAFTWLPSFCHSQTDRLSHCAGKTRKMRFSLCPGTTDLLGLGVPGTYTPFDGILLSYLTIMMIVMANRNGIGRHSMRGVRCGQEWCRRTQLDRRSSRRQQNCKSYLHETVGHRTATCNNAPIAQSSRLISID